MTIIKSRWCGCMAVFCAVATVSAVDYYVAAGGTAALWAVHATNCLAVGNAPYDVMWMTLANTCMWVTDGTRVKFDRVDIGAFECCAQYCATFFVR